MNILKKNLYINGQITSLAYRIKETIGYGKVDSMGVTIKDVAKRAGVATSTVSRTIKDNPNISQATKDKVRKAMQELGYVPNVAAQNLANRWTKNIGLILPPASSEDQKEHSETERIKNPFFMDIITQISQYLNEEQYTATIAAEDTMKKLLKVVQIMHQQKRVDGFILLYSAENDKITRYLLENQIPFVMLGMPTQYENEIRYVDNDNISVGRTATQYLIEKGHEKVGFVGFRNHEPVHLERFEGYFLEMKRQKLQPMEGFDVRDPKQVQEFVSALQDGKFTAIVVSDDILAVKLIPLLATYGYKVGENFSCISINNSIFSTLYHPYLTTVDIHVQELAKQSAKLIIDVLKNPELSLTKYIIPHHIVVRETVIPNKK